jgi:hypothetical protein
LSARRTRALAHWRTVSASLASIQGMVSALVNMRDSYSTDELATAVAELKAEKEREEAENQARLDAMTPEERAAREARLNALLGRETAE